MRQIKTAAFLNAHSDSSLADDQLKQASHRHEFCCRNAPQYGVPSRVSVATSYYSMWRYNCL